VCEIDGISIPAGTIGRDDVVVRMGTIDGGVAAGWATGPMPVGGIMPSDFKALALDCWHRDVAGSLQ
jgi:hypothetical protein